MKKSAIGYWKAGQRFKAAELCSYENINSEEDDDITIIDDQQSDNNDEESNQIMEKFRHLFRPKSS